MQLFLKWRIDKMANKKKEVPVRPHKRKTEDGGHLEYCPDCGGRKIGTSWDGQRRAHVSRCQDYGLKFYYKKLVSE